MPVLRELYSHPIYSGRRMGNAPLEQPELTEYGFVPEPVGYATHTHDDFMQGISKDPDDSTAPMVYADWLEENDMPFHAGLIRGGTQEKGAGPQEYRNMPNNYWEGVSLPPGATQVRLTGANNKNKPLWVSLLQRSQSDPDLVHHYGQTVPWDQAGDLLVGLKKEGAILGDQMTAHFHHDHEHASGKQRQ